MKEWLNVVEGLELADIHQRYKLDITLSGLPKMANNSGSKSTHWRYAMKEAQAWQQAAGYAAKAEGLPPVPLKHFTLKCTRYSSVECDYDGLVRGFKSVVDGLRMVGVIEDDKLSNTGAWDCMWYKCPPKAGRIRVVVEEIG